MIQIKDIRKSYGTKEQLFPVLKLVRNKCHKCILMK